MEMAEGVMDATTVEKLSLSSGDIVILTLAPDSPMPEAIDTFRELLHRHKVEFVVMVHGNKLSVVQPPDVELCCWYYPNKDYWKPKYQHDAGLPAWERLVAWELGHAAWFFDVKSNRQPHDAMWVRLWRRANGTEYVSVDISPEAEDAPGTAYHWELQQ